MKIKLDLSVVIFLLIAAILGTFTLSYMGFSGNWVALRSSTTNNLSKLDEAINIIDERFIGDIDTEEIVDGAISGMVNSLEDRWSYYITSDEYAEYMMNIRNQYAGVGIVIEKKDGIDGIIINSVNKNGPAFHAGIMPESVITHVGDTDITQMAFRDASELMSEHISAGKLVLTVTDKEGVSSVFTLIPGLIEIDPVSSKMVEDNIGLITIKNFDQKSAEQLIAAADELLGKGAKGLIFDVRFNPGGQLSELLKILDYLLPEGTIFMSHEKGKPVVSETSDANCLRVPMAVLINKDSYSAAEFFAAALQEYNWATIIGEKTTGKGYAQITVKLSDGSAIHISSSEYFTPKGASLKDIGIAPDIEVLLTDEQLTDLYYGRLQDKDDDQLMSAIDDIRKQN
ncbi:MAG: S41 family peptidase [Clostridiales bacterium]|nr:S41 family peptidase [Clostridiales bacterium]